MPPLWKERDEALSGTAIEEEAFWSGAAALIREFSPQVSELLRTRDRLQAQIDEFHRSAAGMQVDPDTYEDFLRSIGYLAEEPGDFTITTDRVDPEIAAISGSQLVVPLLNARFAANARWGSLYDALYGTDVLDEEDGRQRTGTYNPVRGAAVVTRGREFLDEHAPLTAGSHADVTAYRIADGALIAEAPDGARGLTDPGCFAGYRGAEHQTESILLVHHGLHVEIQINRTHPTGGSTARQALF